MSKEMLKHAVYVVNKHTGEKNLVGTMCAFADAVLCINALQSSAPAYLEYVLVPEFESVMWVFNFVGGGFNTVKARTKKEAIAAAKKKFNTSGVVVDTASFRYATDDVMQNLYSMFY